MKLPQSLLDKTEWTVAGPLGPLVPEKLRTFPVLAIDGGANFIDRIDVWVGDADSVKKGPTALHLFHHPTEKDSSDLALGLSLFPRTGEHRLHLWGFLGGRRDHELFNLGEVHAFLNGREDSEVLLYDQNGRVAFQFLSKGERTLNILGPFSLGTLRETRVRLTGRCQYPISQHHHLSVLSSFGLSNRGEGEITLYNEDPVFFYYPEAKA